MGGVSAGDSGLQRFRPETRRAVKIVSGALELAGRGVGAADTVSLVGRELVTATDLAVEDAIRSLLTTDLGLPVIGEERGGDIPSDGSAYWLVDPICGSTNFAAGSQLYCVNLALIEADQVTVAVVGVPSTHEIVLAERGRGAWAFQAGKVRRLTASAESEIVVIEDGKSQGARREHVARLLSAAILADRWTCRLLGSTVPAPYLAAGRIAGYVEAQVGPIHAAAGSLLITEAGGTLTDLQGRPWTIQSDSLVAGGSPEFHQELLALVRATAQKA